MTELADLTPRQIAVASLVARAFTVKRIATELSISPQRVRVLISSIAFRIGTNPELDERVQVAQWYTARTALTKPRNNAA